MVISHDFVVNKSYRQSFGFLQRKFPNRFMIKPFYRQYFHYCMIAKKEVKWANWGKQKQAVLQVINRPMTPTEILNKAKQIHSNITFGDVSTLIREFVERGILECLTPTRLTGRIYYLSNHGRKLLWRVYGIKTAPLDIDMDWNKYSRLKAGKTRMVVLKEIYNQRGFFPDGITLTTIRKRLGRIHPMTLSQTYCAIQELLKDGLIVISGYAWKRDSKLYKLTSEGFRICEYDNEHSQENHEHAF